MHGFVVLLLMPAIILVGELFFKLIVLEKKTPRKDFSGHAKAVKEAAAWNEVQAVRLKAQEQRDRAQRSVKT